MSDENPYESPNPIDDDQSTRLPAKRVMTLVLLVIITVPLTSVACAVAFYFGWEIATMIALGTGKRTDDVESWGNLFGFISALLAAGTVAYVMIRIVRNIAEGPTPMERAEPQEPTT